MLEKIYKMLDINCDNGLADSMNKKMTMYQQQFFKMVKEKIGIDAIYFLRDAEGIPKIPLVYFAVIDNYNQKKIAELYRLAWNLGEAPLLFVVTPEQLLIYNNYVAPQRVNGDIDDQDALIEMIDLANTLEAQRQLLKYHRLNFETGEYWRNNEYRFDVKNRVDTTLMNNLRVMRRELIHNIRKRISIKELSDEQLFSIVHALLGRSILIKYLEERKDTEGNTVFPIGYFSKFKRPASKYVDVLDDKEATYSLFRELSEHFHGDMFPLEDREYEIIRQEDLIELKNFISGETDMESKQMALWPLYSFNVIPIQLISSIYELFFHLKVDDKNSKVGTYYTPYHLVSMLMDEVLPWEGMYKDMKILDPSCGSGIFLVEAYRRMVGKWMYTNDAKTISNEQLVKIMQNCIFGVDLNGEAIRIASFSLSLVMCDYLEPRSIWETLEFPRLLGYNLFVNDFFDRGKFDELRYDIIIGNPPWESKLTEKAEKYILENKLIIGDKQIAQAFSWKAGEVCKDTGTICLLMPSKGFLFNRSEKNLLYRKEFFDKYDISIIINYSVFRKILFEHASGPAAAVVYSIKSENNRDPIFYCTPKPTFTLEDHRRFMIEPSDINKIPRDVVDNSLIWKIAMWGTPRDLELINKLTTKYKPLEEMLIEKEMSFAEGFIKGTTKKKEFKEYFGWPLITTKKFKPFNNVMQQQDKVNFTKFYRCTEKNKEVFRGPHLIFKQSPKNGRFLSTVLRYDALFGNSFIGIHGEENILKYISIILYSKVFVYYSLMTSRRWLVERDELNVGELLSFPLPEPSTEEVGYANKIYEEIEGNNQIDEKKIDDFSYSVYKLKSYEIEFIENAVSYVYDYFYIKGKSKALSVPSFETLKEYKEVFEKILQNSLGGSDNISCCFFKGTAPLVVLEISFGNQQTNNEFIIDSTEKVNDKLKVLDAMLISEESGCVAVKRNVRIYQKNKIYVIKPNQSRYWSYSAACKDADEIYADIMATWRKNNE